MRGLVVVLLLGVALAGCAAPPPAVDGPVRTVVHAMGSAEVIGTPQRVVVLDTGELDAVLALGITPVGAVTVGPDTGFPSYLGDRVAGVEQVGTIADPNLEAIAALRPDLILSSKIRHEDIYGALSGIAPTVFAERVGVVWKDNLRLAGEALGRPAEAGRLLDELRTRAQQVGARFGDPAATTVRMVRFVPESVRLYAASSFIGTLLADAGLARPRGQQVAETFVEVSPEQIGQADADLVLYGAYLGAGADAQSAVLAGPLWSTLPAVVAGRAHGVSDDLWYLGIGPIAAGMVLDELAGYAPA